MPRKSAGLLLYRGRDPSDLEVLLVHPGGPFWRNRDEGAWTIPKGEYAEGEDLLEAAKREFKEETGAEPPDGEYLPLRPIKQKNGKIVHGWAIRGDFDTQKLESNSFAIEWPPKSGRTQQFPEVDRAEWFPADRAKTMMLSGQPALIDELIGILIK